MTLHTQPKWKQELADVNAKLSRAEETISALMLGEYQRVGQFTHDGDTVSAFLIHPTRAHGGLVLVQHCVKGQNPSFEIHGLEHLYAELQHKCGASEYIGQLYCLIGKCASVAYRANHPTQNQTVSTVSEVL